MASEVTVNATLAYADAVGFGDALQVLDLLATPATLKPLKTKQLIGTSEEAINLAELTGLGYCFFVNLDPTNYIELKTALGGTIFAKLKAGQAALLPMGSGAQAPAAIANTAACYLGYLLINT